MSEATIFNPFPDGAPEHPLQVLSPEGRRQIAEFKLGLITSKVCEYLADDETYFNAIYGDTGLRIGFNMGSYLYLLDYYDLESEANRLSLQAKLGVIKAAAARKDVPRGKVYASVEVDPVEYTAIIDICRREEDKEEAA